MAVIKGSYAGIGITGYLIFIARKVSTPGVEEAREVFSPPHDSPVNFIIPSSGVIDATNYYVDVYESADGTSLDFLWAQFEYDAASNQLIAEKRFYKVSGPRDIDPVEDQPDLVDPYLDGKSISVFKEGFRYLVPPEETELTKEYDLLSGGGITLLNGQVWNTDEVVIIEINNTVRVTDSASNAGLYLGVMLLTTDTTLEDQHRNKRLECRASGSTIVLTLEDLSTVPEGKYYYITSSQGTHKQVRVVPFAAGQKILLNGVEQDETAVGKGEFLRIEKYEDKWECVLFHSNLSYVGERIMKGLLDVPNTLAEDGALYDGDEYPRIWYWLNTFLPATHKISTTSVINDPYSRPIGKEGLFVVHPTLKKFRMPNTQGWFIRGLKDFDTYNTDTDRVYDYPGGTQNGIVGIHRHTISELKKNDSQGGNQQNTAYNGNDHGAATFSPLIETDDTGTNIGTDNLVKNIGEVFLRRI